MFTRIPARSTVLITGATAGIGKRAAFDLARAGHRVFASGRREDALGDVRTEAAAQGLAIETVRLDVTDPASIAAARAEIDRATGGRGIDVLVNNAGYGQVGPTEVITDADFRTQFETNVFGLMAVTRAFLTRMRERRSGRIVNISSVGGRLTMPFMGPYHATKYALEALSDALRLELAPFGVQVVVIEPGYVRTNFTERSMKEAERYRSEDSPYAPVMKRLEELERTLAFTAVGPEPISRAIRRAVEARRPLARYVAPRSAGLMLLAHRLLPTSWVDALFHLLVGSRQLSLPSA